MFWCEKGFHLSAKNMDYDAHGARFSELLTSRATHAHPTSPRSTGFCDIWDCISSSSSSEKGSNSPERFGCCHGQDQARDMAVNSINRAFGGVFLSGAARARHAARTAVTGSKQYTAGYSTSTGMRGGARTLGTRPRLPVHGPQLAALAVASPALRARTAAVFLG